MNTTTISPQPWSLSGHRALVTGGSRGLGLAIALALRERGAHVTAVARSAETLSALAARGAIDEWIAADITTTAGQQQIAAHLQGRAEPLDILVNNAGTNIRRRTSLEYSAEEVLTLLHANLLSAFALCQLAFPHLRQSGRGSIINVASVAGLTALGTGAPYAMSKAGMIQLTRSFAVEWAPHHIRVNAVAPWYFLTPLTESLLKDPAYHRRVIERTPLGRTGHPEELAHAVTFLAMPAASYITGQCLAVDGGFSIFGFNPRPIDRSEEPPLD